MLPAMSVGYFSLAHAASAPPPGSRDRAWRSDLVEQVADTAEDHVGLGDVGVLSEEVGELAWHGS